MKEERIPKKMYEMWIRNNRPWESTRDRESVTKRWRVLDNCKYRFVVGGRKEMMVTIWQKSEYLYKNIKL